MRFYKRIPLIAAFAGLALTVGAAVYDSPRTHNPVRGERELSRQSLGYTPAGKLAAVGLASWTLFGGTHLAQELAEEQRRQAE